MDAKKRSSGKGVIKNRKKGKISKPDVLENFQPVVDKYAKAAEESHSLKKSVSSSQWGRLIKFATKSDTRFFICLLIFRLLNAWLIRTSFVPDEYWQSIEVAHKAVFGYGHLTWEWSEGLRSYFYPFCFSCYFNLLKLMAIDSKFLISKGPMFLQSVLAALADFYTYKTSFKITSNRRIARWTLLCQLTSWYLAYTSPRTLSNSTEGSLVAIALYFFPWSKKSMSNNKESSSSHTLIFMVISCLSTLMRPTALIVWTPLIVWQLKLSLDKNNFWATIASWVVVGSLMLTVSSIIDYQFYERLTNVHLNFFKFNVVSGLSDTYGTHPWHWYFTQGFVTMMSTHLVMFVMAILQKQQPLFIIISIWTLFIYSFMPHKEFRFLSGILPFSIHLCGLALYHVFEIKPSTNYKTPLTTLTNHKPPLTTLTNAKLSSLSSNVKSTSPIMIGHLKNRSTNHEVVVPDITSKPVEEKHERKFPKIAVASILIILNLIPALYVCLVHQRGSIDVMNYLSEQADANPGGMNVLFLMPCHSTPYYSHIHKNITMRFLTCEPNLENYVDEADEFYSEPSTWIVKQDWSADEGRIASHVVMFESLFLKISEDLYRLGLKKQCAKFFHTHFPSGRLDEYLVVVCK